MRSFSLAFVLTALIALPLQAQPPASHEKGLSSNTAYQTGDIDHVNLFNGNLVLRIPIGQQVPITPTFSYGLTLTYNSNGWDYDERRNLGWWTLRVLTPGCFRCSAFSAMFGHLSFSAESATFQQPGLRAKRGTPGQRVANSGTNRKAGKLVLAKRYNYVDLLPPLPPRSTSGSIPIVISDAYEYRGRDGRTSKHQLRYQLGVTSYLFNTSYTWDEQGNVDRLTYPECLHDVCSGRAPPRVIDHDYERGFLRRVGTYADAIAYQAGGMLRRVPHTNGVSDWIDLAGDGLARPYRMRTEGVANGNWDTGFYVYDGAQNVSNIGPLSFSYDLLSRLTAGDVDAGGAIKRQTATYDAYGNIQQINTGGTVQNPSPNPATNRLAIASYDGAGNVVGATLGNVDFAYDFDPLNMMRHLRSSEDVSRIFVYNASDERVLTFDCAANVCVNDTAVETWSLRGAGGRVLRELSHPWDGGWSWTRDAIYRDGQLLAYEEPGGVVRHLHLDHLGTPRQITDHNGSEVAYHAYYPFGEEATDPQQNEFSLKFTGHERDENGGGVGALDYMIARYCSPSLGRFLSVDPVLGQVGVPQSWNRYAYVRGNPIKFTDPTGQVLKLVMDPKNTDLYKVFLDVLKEARASKDEINALKLAEVNGEYFLTNSGVDFLKSDNPTVRLLGEAISTETTIQVGFGSVSEAYGGAVTSTTFFDTQNFISITMDLKAIAQVLVPGEIASGPLAGVKTALPVTLPTALVHEIGHAHGNFAAGQPGFDGDTVPDAMQAENRHRRLGLFPTIRTAHCSVYPGGC